MRHKKIDFSGVGWEWADLALKMESISSMKITAGCMNPARAKRVRTIFSPSPIHLEVKDEALMLKKVALMLEAMALPIRVIRPCMFLRIF